MKGVAVNIPPQEISTIALALTQGIRSTQPNLNKMARYFSMRLVASAVLGLLLALSMASAQDFGGFTQNGGGGEDGGSGGGGGGGDSQQGGGGGSGGGGGGSQDRGPIQFPPAPMNFEMSSVVIGGSGFGFVPPRAGSGYNYGSFGGYRGGSPFGSGGYRGSGSGYRGSASTNFGGFGGGYGLRGGSGYQAPSHSYSPFGGFGLHYG